MLDTVHTNITAKNYIDIVNYFDKISHADISNISDGLDVVVIGVKNDEIISETYSYKHKEVANEVKTKINYFKGI